jgi:hypothetical protein
MGEQGCFIYKLLITARCIATGTKCVPLVIHWHAIQLAKAEHYTIKPGLGL